MCVHTVVSRTGIQVQSPLLPPGQDVSLPDRFCGQLRGSRDHDCRGLCNVRVPSDSMVNEVASILGQFIRFVTRTNTKEADPAADMAVQSGSGSAEWRSSSSFELILASSRRDNVFPIQSTPRSIVLIEIVRYRKDKVLFNDIVQWIQSLKLGWQSQMDADKTGKDFITVLRYTLWEVDGHWHTLDERSCGVPVTLQVKFLEGYNRPESWSGKKREHGNINLIKLNHLQEKLFEQTCKKGTERNEGNGRILEKGLR